MTDQKDTILTKRVHRAFFVYVLSYALPAIVIAGDMMFGWMAAWLSFFGLGGRLLVGGLERGQTPACYFGVLANVSFVSGYVTFLWRRRSKKGNPSWNVPCRLTKFAAFCAVGSALALVMGSESFYPHIGYFVWLGSMIYVSIHLKRLRQGEDQDS